jgi:phage shock protein E
MAKPEALSSPRFKLGYKSMTIWIVVIAIILAFLLVKRLTQVDPTTAREWLNQGALVVDVRSEAEFRERHLPGAVNIPLDRLGEEITRRAPNKEQPLLLHCLSGARSGVGASRLKRLGYQHVFNLGSYGRAEAILPASGN